MLPCPPRNWSSRAFTSFHEFSSVNKLAEGLTASLIVKPFFEGCNSYFRRTFISICMVKQTLITGIHESSYNSCEKHERKARVENACELLYALKLVKARGRSRAADDLQFLGGWRTVQLREFATVVPQNISYLEGWPLWSKLLKMQFLVRCVSLTIL